MLFLISFWGYRLTILFSLKTAYRKDHTEITATGQGLLDDGRADKMTEGSDIANIWGVYLVSFWNFLPQPLHADAIRKRSPWYMEMHRLMGSSPVVDRSAIGNSNSPINLDVLTWKTPQSSKVVDVKPVVDEPSAPQVCSRLGAVNCVLTR